MSNWDNFTSFWDFNQTSILFLTVRTSRTVLQVGKLLLLLGNLSTLLKVTFNVTVLPLLLKKSPKDLKSQKVPKSLEKSQNVTNLTVKH